MSRGSTGLDNSEYDSWLARNRREKDLRDRKIERARALKKDMSGYMFNIDKSPVKVGGLSDVRKELDRRGLAIYGEYRGKQR